PVVASRSGEVLEVEERFIDDNETPGQENYVLVLHDDDTVTGYYHLTEDGSLVAVGDRVTQGDVIALSGNTGDSSEAHLHFEVFECYECDTLPINFSNTRYHDHGLAEDEDYQAK
ncbi:MAG: murein DD-endopeptidase MepM/ murein hydrolase activator NlpD, partial [bacterium]